MSITQITVYCPTSSMGDNVTDQDANGYRSWLAQELAQEFPGAAVEVLNEQQIRRFDVDTDDNDDIDHLQQFLDNAWDRCAWEWVQSAA